MIPAQALPSRISTRAVLIAVGIYLGAIAALAAYSALDANSRIVAWPIAAIAAVTGAFVLFIRRRDRAPSYFEIGVVYAGIVALYGAYPPLAAAVAGFEFGPLKDARFIVGHPLPSELASLSWWYAMYLAVFCAAYLLTRPRSSLRVHPVRPPGRAIPAAAVILWLGTKLFMLALSWTFGLRADTYVGQYLAVRNLPMVWRQLANVFGGMDVTLQIIILASLFCYYRRTKWMIVVFVGVLVGATVLLHGARTEIAVVVLAAMQLRDQLFRRVPFKAIAVVGAAGFVLYMVMGVLRLEGRVMRLPTLDELTASYTDFEGIFANAYDLKFRLNAAGAFRGQPRLLLADVAGVIPQQFLPFAKTSAALWYAQTYYPVDYAAGGGLAFGMVAEAVAGYGLPQLLLSAALVGVFLGFVQRQYVRGRVGVIFLTFYSWLTITAYQMCRNTTLNIASLTVLHFLPAAVATLLLAAALRRGRALRRYLLPA